MRAAWWIVLAVVLYVASAITLVRHDGPSVPLTHLVPTPTAAAVSPEPVVVASSRTTPTVASRSRAVTPPPPSGIGSHLDWDALARCESGGNPRAVSPTGRYRGAFQMNAAFWRTYGGLAFAARPELASFAEQLVVAQRGYAARGSQPWPTCGRVLQ